MKKAIDIFLKVLLSLLLIMPILGATGIFPAPTPDLYSNARAFEFIKIMMDTHYINIMMAVVFLISLVCLWTKRTALAALLILPITLNIIGFHAFMDSGLFTGGAVMGDILLLLNLYFLWQNKETYKSLTKKSA